MKTECFFSYRQNVPLGECLPGMPLLILLFLIAWSTSAMGMEKASVAKGALVLDTSETCSDGSPIRSRNNDAVRTQPAAQKESQESMTHQHDTTLTVDRIFSKQEFAVDRHRKIVWSRMSESYLTLAASTDDAESDQLIRIDNASGRVTIVASVSDLTPVGSDRALKVESFQLSADESKILIYTNTSRVWRRNTRGDYWVFDLETGRLTQLGGDAASSSMMFAKFSPDATEVGYVLDHNIYVQQLSDLTVRAVTSDGSPILINGTSDWVNEEEFGLRDCFRFSPDGRSILFWQFDTTGVGLFHLLDNTAGKYPRLVSFPYPKVGETNSASRVGVVSSHGGDVCWLQTPGDPREHYIPQAEWTPDGSGVLVEQFNRLQNENRVLLCNPQTGVARQIMTESDSAWLENENPVRWVNDGHNLLWLSERSGWRHAWLANIDGDPMTPVTQGEFDVIDVAAVDAVGGWLYFIASPENATQRYLYRATLTAEGRKKGIERLTPANQPGWHRYDISPDASWAVHTWSTFMTPPVVELIRLPDHSMVRVLANNEVLKEKLNTLHQPSQEFLKVDLGNGVVLDGWCLKPADFDPSQKYPLLIYVYGEPHGTTVTDAWTGSRGLWHWMLAQQGCIVASFDNRGTNAPRGREWRKCVSRKIGIVAPPEQAAALKWLLAHSPYIDPDRVGIWGWSGGGSMSLNAIFRYPDLYCTAVAVAPNANQLLYDTIYQERYMGLPDENAEGYRDGSPISHAHGLQGNLLLVHGTGDDNGHFQGTEFLMNELIAQGKHFSVMPYPHRSHSIQEGKNTVPHFWSYLTRYLQDNLITEHAKQPKPETGLTREQ